MLMKEKTYKEKLNSFRSSCRIYKKELQDIAAYQKKTNVRYDDPERYLQKLMKDDVSFVERMFDRLEEKCGSNARVVVWLLYVENNTQENVAKDLGLTRRQLQYAVDKWLHAVLDEPEEPISGE